MKITTIFAATTVAAGLTLAALPASASTIDNRQANQAARIHQGVKSGALTAAEAYRLKQQQAEIAELERRLKRDGRLNAWDKWRLTYLQNQASRQIYLQKHDGDVAQRQWYKPWGWYRSSDNVSRPYFGRWW